MTDDRDDPYQLNRFVTAQADQFERALAEIRAGTKRTHWMWFIFPQIAGLGHSAMARHYAISGLDEARAYLAHPILGERLNRCVAVLQALPHAIAIDVFGPTDVMKLRSSLTLFVAAGGGFNFAAALDRWFGGAKDPATMTSLSAAH